MAYNCPLCGSSLTEHHYHKVIKDQEKKEKVQKGALKKFKKEAAVAKAAARIARKQEQETRAKTEQKVAAARKQGTLAERSKRAIRDKRMMARYKKMQEEMKMLKNHTSPQEIGLADEGVLVKRLEMEFPDDRIEHVGKGGDVLHYVIFDNNEEGCIVYECKHKDGISSADVTQTALAKKTRQAYYGILVTTGTRKGFSGLDREAGVFLVAQAGVLALALLCRESLVGMAKQRLDATEKAAVAKRLMDYVMSPGCKTPLEEAISHTKRAHKNLLREIKQHFDNWKERHELYQTIHYDVSHVQANIDRVLGGDEPFNLEKPKFEPLALPLK